MLIDKASPLILLAFLAAGCSTTADAPAAANVSSQDLAYLTSAYQLIHFDLSACAALGQSDIPAYAASVVFNVCSAGRKYKPLLESTARDAGATLPDQLDFDHQSETISLAYGTGYANLPRNREYHGPVVPAYSVSGMYPSPIVQFLQYEVASHEASLADFQSEARLGRKPEIKAVAKQYEPLVRQNLHDLQAALDEAKHRSA